MKAYSAFLLLITTNGFIALTFLPAKGDNPAQSQRRQVRVTTGVGEVQGWEQQLTEKNPNLARWHWDPIYYYKQGYGTLTPRTLKGDSRPTGKQSSQLSRYTLPRQITQPYSINSARDSRPLHIPFSPQAMEKVQGRLFRPKAPSESTLEHGETLFGQLTKPPLTEPPIATYKNVLPDEPKNSLNTALKYRSLKTDVYGQLLNSNSKNKSTNKNIDKRKSKTSGNKAKP